MKKEELIMKTLYLECNMGISGDMFQGALYDLLPPSKQTDFLNKMNHLGLSHVEISPERESKCGIFGTHMHVKIDGKEEHEHEHHHEHVHTHCDHPHEHEHGAHSHEHHSHEHTGESMHSHVHHSLHDITHILNHLPTSDRVKEDAQSIYHLIAEAEAKAHETSVEQIHFHEVGNLDAIADIVGSCILMEMLAPKQVILSPVHVGSGFVHCAHGILPVPAPATASILEGIPIYSNGLKGELTTPTGAAIAKYFSTGFGDLPLMTIQASGYGLGTKDFSTANVLRAFLGETTAETFSSEQNVAELRCNLDDMTAEAISYVKNQLLELGALDVYTSSIQMKKDRPGILLVVICPTAQADSFTEFLLTETSTAGVRKLLYARTTLDYTFSTLETPYGEVKIKHYSFKGKEKKKKPEYEDIAAIAKKQQLPFLQIYHEVLALM